MDHNCTVIRRFTVFLFQNSRSSTTHTTHPTRHQTPFYFTILTCQNAPSVSQYQLSTCYTLRTPEPKMNSEQQAPKNPQAPKDPHDHQSPHTPNDQDSIFGYEIPAPLRAAIKMLRSVIHTSANLNAQLERWLPVLAALRQLGNTSQKLGHYFYHFLTHDTDSTDNAKNTENIKSPLNKNPLPLELLAELQTGFTDLIQTFPDVASFFLDIEKIDQFLADILLNPENALPGHRLFKLVNEQSTRAIGKFVEITIVSATKEAPSAEATHAFLQRAEHLLDSILQRWIWPIVDPTHSTNLPDEQTP